MFKNYFTIIVISLASVFAAQAQEWDWATSANYSVGIPTGDLKEFTDNVSGRGFIFEARRLWISFRVGDAFGHFKYRCLSSVPSDIVVSPTCNPWHITAQCVTQIDRGLVDRGVMYGSIQFELVAM